MSGSLILELRDESTSILPQRKRRWRRLSGKTQFGDIRDFLFFVFPPINRTKSMVGFAQELERKRTELFAPLHSYESVANSFISNKQITVTEKGSVIKLLTHVKKPNSGLLEWRHLSSGEKQILILLTQALLSEREPVVYVADEPELSLHVKWQEMLMASLIKLAGRCQFIVAYTFAGYCRWFFPVYHRFE